jgi:hypothetical protein
VEQVFNLFGLASIPRPGRDLQFHALAIALDGDARLFTGHVDAMLA